jgi:hypothetical protein
MAAGLAALHHFLRELRHESHNLPSNRIIVLSPGGKHYGQGVVYKWKDVTVSGINSLHHNGQVYKQGNAASSDRD